MVYTVMKKKWKNFPIIAENLSPAPDSKPVFCGFCATKKVSCYKLETFTISTRFRKSF